MQDITVQYYHPSHAPHLPVHLSSQCICTRSLAHLLTLAATQPDQSPLVHLLAFRFHSLTLGSVGKCHPGFVVPATANKKQKTTGQRVSHQKQFDRLEDHCHPQFAALHRVAVHTVVEPVCAGAVIIILILILRRGRGRGRPSTKPCLTGRADQVSVVRNSRLLSSLFTTRYSSLLHDQPWL